MSNNDLSPQLGGQSGATGREPVFVVQRRCPDPDCYGGEYLMSFSVDTPCSTCDGTGWVDDDDLRVVVRNGSEK